MTAKTVLVLGDPPRQRYRYVNKIGVELEGGWNGNVPFQLEHDGSVHVTADYTGEVPSPPLRPQEVVSWMREHYPDAVNDTCGMHVHVSVKHQWHYARLMDKEFFDFLKTSLAAWGKKLSIREEHPFWARLRGGNDYCKDEFHPELQIQHRDKGGERYTMLNYTWSRYRTVECRVLPGFAACEIAISAVLHLVNTFEEYLVANCRSTTPSLEGLVRVAEVPLDNEDQIDLILPGDI